MTTEAHAVAEILNGAAGDTRLRLWKSHTGTAVPLIYVIRALRLLEHGKADEGHALLLNCPRIQYGIPGAADLTGLRALDGKRLEVEVKGPKGRQSKQQERFQSMVERFGGVYVLARGWDDVEGVL